MKELWKAFSERNPVFICHADLVEKPPNKHNISTVHGNMSFEWVWPASHKLFFSAEVLFVSLLCGIPEDVFWRVEWVIVISSQIFLFYFTIHIYTVYGDTSLYFYPFFNDKSKAAPEDVWGEWASNSTILNFDSRWRCIFNFRYFVTEKIGAVTLRLLSRRYSP